jgi:hypothetical protein
MMTILICSTLIIITSIICFTIYKLYYNDVVKNDIDDIKFIISQLEHNVEWLQTSANRTFDYLTKIPLVKKEDEFKVKEDQFKVTYQND